MTFPDGFFQRPAVARIDNYLTGDVDNYEADRLLAARLVNEAPWLPDTVKINRRHGSRAVTVLAHDLGIRQYLDLGCGLPTSWNRRLQRSDPASTYEAAAGVHADARVVYVDNDPMVHGHARMMLDVCSSTKAVLADVREIGELLNDPAVQALDNGQPTAVLLHEVLPWVSDELVEKAMAALRDWLPDGSAISVTHATTEMAPDAMQALVGHYANAGITYRPRTLEQIRKLLAPWATLPPGVVPTTQWRAGSSRSISSGDNPGAYAAIATPTRSDALSPSTKG
ncbi:SAM-dependent methyltransferase [Streptomyces scopuliridis]|uniref:SAM-dependent methyltransferase n=1 Tax=Streptomyces scopuliridis TaxID=452529 RepID=UPI002DD9599F|nr:SAM-dependent methyltransferase [Streptomyces scopuliridis]WSB37486.1 SAM-dependent methyltransferase [Streptomyces scopuliridis]